MKAFPNGIDNTAYRGVAVARHINHCHTLVFVERVHAVVEAFPRRFQPCRFGEGKRSFVVLLYPLYRQSASISAVAVLCRAVQAATDFEEFATVAGDIVVEGNGLVVDILAFSVFHVYVQLGAVGIGTLCGKDVFVSVNILAQGVYQRFVA